MDFSLPPCGGGLGWGVASQTLGVRAWTATVIQRCGRDGASDKLAVEHHALGSPASVLNPHTPHPTLPHKGGGLSYVGTSRLSVSNNTEASRVPTAAQFSTAARPRAGYRGRRSGSALCSVRPSSSLWPAAARTRVRARLLSRANAPARHRQTSLIPQCRPAQSPPTDNTAAFTRSSLNDRLPRIALTLGDIAGIGPEVIVRLGQIPRYEPLCCPFVVGHVGVLESRGALRFYPTLGVQAIDEPEAALPSDTVIPCSGSDRSAARESHSRRG